MTSDTVSRDVFTVLHGQPAPVVTRWTYTIADPFAVTLGVRTRGDRFVEWLVARDLVLDALHGPAGCGDVRMSPQRVHGRDVVEIEIRMGDGRAVLEVDRDLVAEFLDASNALVPVGTESGHVDLDAEIDKLTSRTA
jgi:hypothetical protein